MLSTTSMQSQPWRSSDRSRRLGSGWRSSTAREHYAITFGASGNEYFRIWIAGVLLTLATLGLYYPWARVRRLRYLYRRIVVAGQTLDFHGEPRHAVRDTLLTAGLIALVGLAWRVGPLVGALAVLMLAALWPALWHAALQMRLAGTSWRDQRFHFSGTLRATYAVFAVPGLLLLALAAAALALRLDSWQPSSPSALLPLALLLLIGLALPPAWLRLKRYQHGHYHWGELRTELRLKPRPVYETFLHAGVMLLLAVVAGALLYLGAARLIEPGAGTPTSRAPLLAAGLAVSLLVQIAPHAFLAARLQNLLWSRTGNDRMRLRSDVHARALARLMLKNGALILVTLGLYWPWAVVATMRLKLEAVSLHTRGPLEDLVGLPAPLVGDAANDTAAGSLHAAMAL